MLHEYNLKCALHSNRTVSCATFVKSIATVHFFLAGHTRVPLDKLYDCCRTVILELKTTNTVDNLNVLERYFNKQLAKDFTCDNIMFGGGVIVVVDFFPPLPTRSGKTLRD